MEAVAQPPDTAVDAPGALPAAQTVVESSSIPEQTEDVEVDMAAIAKMNLPFDVQLLILKELLLLWATKIPKQHIYPGSPTLELQEAAQQHFPPTNRAYLRFCELGSLDHTSNPPSNNMTSWAVLPSYIGVDEIYRSSPSEETRTSRILGLATLSKKFGPPLKTFFFRQMIWQFNNADAFQKVIYGSSYVGCGNGFPRFPRFPRECVQKFTTIALTGFEWISFCQLLEALYSTLMLDETALPNLRLLEITAVASGMKIKERMLHTTTLRIRYLVTRCYQIAKKYPELIISIRGACDNHWAALGDQYDGLGYSEEETKSFANGTSELLSGLKQIEFPDVEPDRYQGSAFEMEYKFDWQMAIGFQWKQIWAQGIEVDERHGGYPLVTRPRSTW